VRYIITCYGLMVTSLLVESFIFMQKTPQWTSLVKLQSV